MLVRTVDSLELVTANEIRDGQFKFYAICWPCNDSFMGFVTKADPIKGLAPGFRYFQYGDVLRKVESPNFLLIDRVDLVVGSEELAVCSPDAFKNLFADVGVIFGAVPEDVVRVRRYLESSVPLTAEAVSALEREAQRVLSVARRLRQLPLRLSAIKFNVARLHASLRRHGVDASLLLDSDGNLSFTQDRVRLFLDVVECRFFEDDLGGERRRADRYSKRA